LLASLSLNKVAEKVAERLTT